MQKSFTCPALLCVALFANTAQATEGAAPAVRPMPPIDVKSYVLMDYQTGQILASKQPEKELPPASTTKLMTAYVTFQALNHGYDVSRQQESLG